MAYITLPQIRRKVVKNKVLYPPRASRMMLHVLEREANRVYAYGGCPCDIGYFGACHCKPRIDRLTGS